MRGMNIQGSHVFWKTWKIIVQFSSHGKDIKNERKSKMSWKSPLQMV